MLSPEMAIDYGCTGPVLRGSGVDHDLRRDGEAALHRNVRRLRLRGDRARRTATIRRITPIRRCPHAAVLGDCWHRFYVRMLEVCSRSTWCGRPSTATARPTGSLRRAGQADREAAQGRGLSGNRGPTRPDGLLSSSATAASIPWRARARSSSLLQSVGDARAVPRLPDRRRAGDRRLAGHRDGRNRSLSRHCRPLLFRRGGPRRKTPTPGACPRRVVCAIFHDLSTTPQSEISNDVGAKSAAPTAGAQVHPPFAGSVPFRTIERWLNS